MNYSFSDKHGRTIIPGMTLRHSNGSTEIVYPTTDAFGNESLGFMATSQAFLKHHPDYEIEYYNLGEFDLSEWEIETMTYSQIKDVLTQHERSNPAEHLNAHIVFSEDSWNDIYPLFSRTYAISSYNKAFLPGMGGYSIFGDSLDGTDRCIRLEAYMAEEHGGNAGWKVDYCYLVRT